MLQSNMLHLWQKGMMFGLMTTCVINLWCWELLLQTLACVDGTLEHCMRHFVEVSKRLVVSRMLFKDFCVWFWLVV